MSLSPGDKLGPYEILSPIGKGGMGEVYRARDRRLNREVAIKTSAERFGKRFEREAHAIAALNHPNICTLYDVGPNYLVMELVEGESPKGPLPVEEVVRLGRQIATALEAAHEKGIVHRDLKPGNIKVKADGAVKVLDFGLAKVTPAEASASGEESPTFAMAATQAGVVLGTAAYMAPEQARGKTVDKRADIWAFGVVLYELVTGERLFKGEDLTEILASVVKETPDLSKTPPELRRLLKKCLARDPKERLRDIGDAWELLEPGSTDIQPVSGARSTQSRVAWIAAAVATLAAFGLAALYFNRSTPEPALRKVAILAPENASFDPGSVPQISPDGRYLAFKAILNGVAGLWVRDPDSLTPRLLPGTQGANLPFWSPDSRSLAFLSAGKLRKVDTGGGPVITLCDAPGGTGRGGSWSQNGVIVYTTGTGGVFRVSDSGGDPAEVTRIDPARLETIHRSPWFLPDGRHFLYTAVSTDPTKSGIFVGDAEAGLDAPRKLAAAVHSNAVYAWPGYLLYVRDRTLMAQPFDAGSGESTGTAVPVAEELDFTPLAALAQFSASQTGVLVYTSGGGGGGEVQLTWYDRNGKPQGLVGGPSATLSPAVSPDGNFVAIQQIESQSRVGDVWLYDLRRQFASRFGPGRNHPAWSPDGSQVAFSGYGGAGLYRKAVSGGAPEETLHNEPTRLRDWSGDYLIEQRFAPDTFDDIWLVPLSDRGKPSPLLNTNASETYAKVSPSGRWLAYASDESRQNEVYVVSFPKPGRKWQVSTAGGSRPVWSRNGKELYYLAREQGVAREIMMAVDVREDNGIEFGAPRRLFQTQSSLLAQFDVHPDGRFLLPARGNENVTVPITMVLDWPAALKR